MCEKCQRIVKIDVNYESEKKKRGGIYHASFSRFKFRFSMCAMITLLAADHLDYLRLVYLVQPSSDHFAKVVLV